MCIQNYVCVTKMDTKMMSKENVVVSLWKKKTFE